MTEIFSFCVAADLPMHIERILYIHTRAYFFALFYVLFLAMSFLRAVRLYGQNEWALYIIGF